MVLEASRAPYAVLADQDDICQRSWETFALLQRPRLARCSAATAGA